MQAANRQARQTAIFLTRPEPNGRGRAMLNRGLGYFQRCIAECKIRAVRVGLHRKLFGILSCLVRLKERNFSMLVGVKRREKAPRRAECKLTAQIPPPLHQFVTLWRHHLKPIFLASKLSMAAPSRGAARSPRNGEHHFKTS